MKIAILHSVTSYGGSIMSLLDLIKMLSPSHHITVYMPDRAVEQAKTAVKASKAEKVVFFDKQPMLFSHFSGVNTLINLGFWHRLLYFYHNSYWYEELCHKYDVVLLNSSVLSPLGAYLHKRGIPTICFDRETHNLMFMGILDRIMRRYLNRNSGVCFLSKMEEAHFSLDIPTCVIPDVLDIDAFTTTQERNAVRDELHIPHDATVLLFVGGISELKGTHCLLESFSKMAAEYPDVHLLLLGPEPKVKNAYFQNCMNAIAQSDRIQYLGNRQKIGNYYLTSDILVFPSTKSHQARPVYEAGYYHLPVVISDFKETSDSAIDGYNALCFEPGSADDLTAKLRLLMKDTKRRETLGNNNYHMYFIHHSMENVGKELNSFIENIV